MVSEALISSYTEIRRMICYPTYNEEEFKKRVDALNSYNIRLMRSGRCIVDGFNILGKGHNAIVIKGLMDDKEVAVKIRRIDSKRENMLREAYAMRIVNSIGIAPRLFHAMDDILIMEYIDGLSIGELLSMGEDERIRCIVRGIFDECFMLDLIGLDHGELSVMNKHIIVDDEKAWIIDFDSASFRRVSNLTSAIQYLIRKGILEIDSLDPLREYKRCICYNCFYNILSSLKVK